jgi:hypothetical protein
MNISNNGDNKNSNTTGAASGNSIGRIDEDDDNDVDDEVDHSNDNRNSLFMAFNRFHQVTTYLLLFFFFSFLNVVSLDVYSDNLLSYISHYKTLHIY